MKNKIRKTYLGDIKDKEAEMLIWKKIPFKKRIELARQFSEDIRKIQRRFKINTQ